MSYNKKFRYFSVKQWVYFAVAIICMIIILYEGYLLYSKIFSGNIINTSAEIGSGSKSNTIAILQAKQDMEQGELLDVSKLEMIEVPVELAPKGAVTSLSRLDAMRLKHKVAERELLNELDLMPEAAALEEEDRLMEHNFEAGTVPAAVVPGSVIDIKLFIRGGADPVVVSKAVVISRNAELLSFYMNEREQELIKEAASEGILFAVQYIEDSQRPSIVTYTAAFEKGGQANER